VLFNAYMPMMLCNCQSFIKESYLLTERQTVTDRQTDRQTLTCTRTHNSAFSQLLISAQVSSQHQLKF